MAAEFKGLLPDSPPERQASSPSPPPPYQPWAEDPPHSVISPEMLSPEHQYAWHRGDPRTSSTQSLVPSFNDEDDDRRTLLVVYVHGFMGDNTSFRSFPAHVHNYLRESLADSHVIHSKVYPRYKTYKAIEVARDNFSKWLEPHESDRTDVVLVGHSMGGLLVADVALMPSTNPVYGHPFKHRIIGTVSLDAPLLGLHPGIIKSGIASLFRKAPDPPGKGQELADSLAAQNASGSFSTNSFSTDDLASGMSSPGALTNTSSNNSGYPSSSQQTDPNFNPPFFNDVQFIDRGWWRNVAHFAKKHYNEGLFTSTYQHLLSHLEFGSCLADYAALNSRYNKIRKLEDIDELHQAGNTGAGRSRAARVRFVNYYTVSTGIPKEPPPPKRADTHLKPETASGMQQSAASSQASTPRISIDDYSDGERLPMQTLDPVPEPDSDHEAGAGSAAHQTTEDENDKGKKMTSPADEDVAAVGESSESHKQGETAAPVEGDENNDNQDFENDLPAIPPAPDAPETPDFTRYTDKDARKQAEKEFKRVQKTYEQAVKNREKALRERQKLVEKRRKKAQKDAEKKQKDEEKRSAKALKDQQKQKTKEEAEQQQQQQRAIVEEDDTHASSSPQAQVVTQAQARALERQLTDLALHDSRSSTTSPPFSPPPDLPPRDKGATADKNKKLRKFCMLPQKINGARDPTWVSVYMEGVDEVGAHCGLFFPGPQYETLVGEVGARITGWVQEDLSKRAILAMG